MLLDQLLDPIFLRVLLCGCGIGLLCGIISIPVVLRSLGFLGEGLGHSSLLGIALASVLGFSPWLGALASCCVVCLLLTFYQRKFRFRADIVLAILFSAFLGVAVIVLNQSHAAGKVRFQELLFGSLLLVGNTDIITIGIVLLIVLSAAYWFSRPSLLFLVDEGLLQRQGYSAQNVHLMLYFLISLVVVASIKVCGVLLTTALLTVPGAVSLQFAKNIKQAVQLSAFVGVATVFLGILFSWVFDTPPGATIVVSGSFLFLVSIFFDRTQSSHL